MRITLAVLFIFMFIFIFLPKAENKVPYTPMSEIIFSTKEKIGFSVNYMEKIGLVQYKSKKQTDESQNNDGLKIVNAVKENKLVENSQIIEKTVENKKEVVVQKKREKKLKNSLLPPKHSDIPFQPLEEKVEANKSKELVVVTSSEKKQSSVEISFHLLNQTVKNSNNSYFFSNHHLSLKDVIVTLISLTPFEENKILMFTITNQQMEYFFIGNIAFYDKQKLISTDLFSDLIVAPGKTINCFALIPKISSSQISIMVTESGGKNRAFLIPFLCH